MTSQPGGTSSEQNPGGRVAQEAARKAYSALNAGGPLDREALDSAAKALAIVRRVFEAASGGATKARKPVDAKDRTSPLRRALWAVEAAGTLVALRRGPRGEKTGTMPTESILVEILKEAERVLNEASPESSRGSSDGSPPEVLEAVEEGTRKALWLARRLAERSQSAST